MGMGYGANMAMVISQDDLKKVVPDEFQAFLNMLDNLNVSLDEAANEIQYEYGELDELDEEQYRELFQSWEDLNTGFKEKTGIRLWLSYHDPDNGSRYDDVNGAFFQLDWRDSFQETPELKMLRQMDTIKPDVKYWVTYG